MALSGAGVLMFSGRLRSRITLQRRSVTRDATGAEVETWAELSTVWADIEALPGREFWASQAVTSSQVLRFRVRYLAGVTTLDRILYDGRLWNIRSAPPDPNSRELVLTAEEVK